MLFLFQSTSIASFQSEKLLIFTRHNQLQLMVEVLTVIVGGSKIGEELFHLCQSAARNAYSRMSAQPLEGNIFAKFSSEFSHISMLC
jgi:hypothetical protein